MQPLGIVDSLIETMILPVRRWRVALPLSIASSVALLGCVFGFDDSAAFGYPIDYTVIGLRLPHVVFGAHGWLGIAGWLASFFLFTSTLAVWVLAISQGATFRPEPATFLKRCLQFFAANLLVPVTFVPLVAAVYLSNLEDLIRDEPNNWYDLPFGLSDDVFPIVAVIGPPLIWLCLRLALWPSMILFTGWHGALRRAWVAGRGSMLRLLCHVVVMAIAVVKIGRASCRERVSSPV